jgi:hypothetical protein
MLGHRTIFILIKKVLGTEASERTDDTKVTFLMWYEELYSPSKNPLLQGMIR